MGKFTLRKCCNSKSSEIEIIWIVLGEWLSKQEKNVTFHLKALLISFLHPVRKNTPIFLVEDNEYNVNNPYIRTQLRQKRLFKNVQA